MLIRGRLLCESSLPLIASGPQRLLTFSSIIRVNTVSRRGGGGGGDWGMWGGGDDRVAVKGKRQSE